MTVAVGEGVRDAEGSGVAFETDAGSGVAKISGTTAWPSQILRKVIVRPNVMVPLPDV